MAQEMWFTSKSNTSSAPTRLLMRISAALGPRGTLFVIVTWIVGAGLVASDMGKSIAWSHASKITGIVAHKPDLFGGGRSAVKYTLDVGFSLTEGKLTTVPVDVDAATYARLSVEDQVPLEVIGAPNDQPIQVRLAGYNSNNTSAVGTLIFLLGCVPVFGALWFQHTASRRHAYTAPQARGGEHDRPTGGSISEETFR